MVGSRRISSAIASRMASPNPISLVASRTGVAVAASGINVLGHSARIRVRRVDRELHRRIHFGDQLFLDRIERRAIGDAVLHQPLLLFGLRPVVGAGDVADVVAVIAIGDALQERGTLAAAGALDVLRGRLVDGAGVLAVDRFVGDAEGRGAGRDIAGRRFAEMRVLVVAVVLADKDDGQLPQLRVVHLLVEDPLAERALAEEADRHAAVLQILRREGGAGGNAGAAADDGVRTEVARIRVGDVHRAALALAVPRFLAEELGKHPIGGRPLRQAVSMAAVRAGDVVVRAKRLADADGNRFLADVEVRQARHQRARIEIVDALLEQPDGNHLPVQADQLLLADVERRLLCRLRRGGHAGTPESLASTWNSTAQSSFSRPRPRAAVRNWLATAAVGSATPSCLPMSSA